MLDKDILALACSFMSVKSQNELYDKAHLSSLGELKAELESLLPEKHLLTKAAKIKDLCLSLDIKLCSLFSDHYPKALKYSNRPPWLLYYKGGDLSVLENTISIAIVGARKADFQGLDIAFDLAKNLSLHGICIVSGLALGIDTAAHQGSLVDKSGGKTVAVLAHGLDTVYPASNKSLAANILKQNGLLISAYPPGEKPLPYRFLERNFIVSGLSKCVIVVQAGKRSGTLSTARYALESGRDVCAVPGNINHRLHSGTHSLIQQGAHLITGYQDILNLYPEISSEKLDDSAICDDKTIDNELSETGAKIVALLKVCDGLHFTDIAKDIPDKSSLNQEILTLELNGIIQGCGGNRYTLTTKA